MNNEPAIAALRVEQLLARAEQEPVSDDELHTHFNDLCQRVNKREAADIVEAACEETVNEYADHV